MEINVEEVLSNKNYNQFIQCYDLKQDDEGKDILLCRVIGCCNKYHDKSAAIRHVRQSHRDIYDAIQVNKINRPNDSTAKESFEIRVRVNPKDIYNACIDLVTVNAMPLAILDCPAFKKILEPYAIALKMKGIDLVVNRKNIKNRIAERASQIKKIITSQMSRKMICLMVDIASRYCRSVLGVNVAYFDKGKIKVRTIGMHVIRCSQTAANIVKMIKKDLSDYCIQLKQLVAVTTDNGKNMVKAIVGIDSEFQSEINNFSSTSDSDSSDDDFNIDSDIFDGQYYEDLLAKVRSEFQQCYYTDMIHGISCAAHCLNLVVSKAIKRTDSIKNLLEKCRELVKKLRTPRFRTMLETSNQNMAIIDVKTRWNSVFSMVILLILFYRDENNRHCG